MYLKNYFLFISVTGESRDVSVTTTKKELIAIFL